MGHDLHQRNGTYDLSTAYLVTIVVAFGSTIIK